MEQKNNTGSVFVNQYKTNEKHPDFKGTGNFDGKKFDLALWFNKTKEGKEFFSISFSEPYKKEEVKTKTFEQIREEFTPLEHDEEDLPF